MVTQTSDVLFCCFSTRSAEDPTLFPRTSFSSRVVSDGSRSGRPRSAAGSSGPRRLAVLSGSSLSLLASSHLSPLHGALRTLPAYFFL